MKVIGKNIRNSETTEVGGVSSILVGTCAANSQDFNELILDITDSVLPASFSTVPTHVAINLSNLTTDLDVTSYAPTGLPQGAQIRITKTDQSTGKILFTDPVSNVSYEYMNRMGDVLTLYWNGSNFRIQ